ncbi:helix-turn-helix domain-containing protein [Bdellovibrio sp. HCB274]|uniref:helix-turn-helix domain-containing protein n=1 Tax=Bdellovibrio sp. HCB274 TaxID=3394361 RepID=UPI0039B6196B
MELKSILRKLIKEKGLTVACLSRGAKVPVQTLHGWLHGVEPKSIRQLKSVADYLEVDLDYLCFGIRAKADRDKIEKFEDEINAGVFEVVLRRIKR